MKKGYLKLKFRNYIGIVIGFLFIASSLVPMGVYHHEGEEGITGVLWNFMIPTGWSYMLVGVVLIFHKRLRLENKRLAFVMFVAGLLFYPLLLRQNVDYWLGLWRGTTSDYDAKSLKAFGWLRLMFYFPFYVGLTSIFASLLVMINGRTNEFRQDKKIGSRERHHLGAN